MKEAALYEVIASDRVRCNTCAHGCVIKVGNKGICGVRENQDGKLISLVHSKAIAMHVDPVEKKPLFHFQPGSGTLSVATAGCNMVCPFCQNASISQSPVETGKIYGEHFPPEAVVDSAIKGGCASISYTYTEPAVYWDYAFDTARLAKARGLKNLFVTNGFWSDKSLISMMPYMDAANVDLKAFDNQTYKKMLGANLDAVLNCLRVLAESDVWLEVTTLLVPGLNDSEEEIRKIAEFLCDLNPDIPWHVSRFHPTYKMQDRPPTPVTSILNALETGRDVGLKYIYAGNVPGENSESTFCSGCGNRIIERWGFAVRQNRLNEGCCPDCGEPAAGVW